ncbi:30S ribosomal protein S6 alpha, chloroplastic [Juglans regia]|uniref:30S ribosomal protein S6 alpha, chloroplastic n=2 Tax=Juglans regia TaxID=51240 RepID=A0A2I4FUA0_JUGRE|nr:30S ribosomal protein S6 alpha, chloroplastic [Juglans regia]
MAMASSALTSTLTPPQCPSNPPFLSSPLAQFPCPPAVSFSHSVGLRACPSIKPKSPFFCRIRRDFGFCVKAQTLDFSGSFFEGGFGSDEDPPSPPGPGTTDVEEKEAPQCPPGLRQYETMVVLRPDMSEDERLALTQKYEELLVAGGGMYVEVFNRGVIPLAYSIQKKNKAGESNTYLDGIYLLFTYFTKPESLANLEQTLKPDDDVIRSMSFKIRKRKLV